MADPTPNAPETPAPPPAAKPAPAPAKPAAKPGAEAPSPLRGWFLWGFVVALVIWLIAAFKSWSPLATTALYLALGSLFVYLAFSAATLAWATFGASMGAMTIGTVRFLVPNTKTEPGKFKAGFPDQFEDGKVVERFKDQNTWIVRDQGVIYALSTTCTHLGCTPNWLEREGKFKCPCHGSGFYMSGINFEGPAPRPLERWAIRIGDDGQIVVDRSKKFQQERGEWSSPESFIKV